MSHEEIPWPQKGDALFKPDTDWWYNACLGYSPHDDLLFLTGYRAAAVALVQRILEDRQGRDGLIYPVVFLYRHYLELMLKQIAAEGSGLLGLEPPDLIGHRVLKLWQICRPIVERIWPDNSADDLDAVEACLKQLDEKDCSSQSFRYPRSPKGERLLRGMTHINVRNLSDVLEGVSNLLEGCLTGILDTLATKREIERDMG